MSTIRLAVPATGNASGTRDTDGRHRARGAARAPVREQDVAGGSETVVLVSVRRR